MTSKRIARRQFSRSITDGRVSEIDRIEADPRESLELAAAILLQRTNALLLNACHARPDVTNREIAERLGVTEGRVSQVLSGEDAPRISTVARYMRAYGYNLIIHAVPAEADAPDFDAVHTSAWNWAAGASYVRVVASEARETTRAAMVDVGTLTWERAEAVTSHELQYVNEMRMING